MGAARYVANGASDGALDELVAEARKDATLMAARVTRSGGTLTSHGVIVWKPASTASGRRVYKLGKPLCENQPVRTPSSRRRDGDNVAWGAEI